MLQFNANFLINSCRFYLELKYENNHDTDLDWIWWLMKGGGLVFKARPLLASLSPERRPASGAGPDQLQQPDRKHRCVRGGAGHRGAGPSVGQ